MCDLELEFKCQPAGKPWRQAVGISLRVGHQANLLAVRIIFWVHLETCGKKITNYAVLFRGKMRIQCTCKCVDYAENTLDYAEIATAKEMSKQQWNEFKAVQGLIHNLRPWKKECTSLIFCQLWHVLDFPMVFVETYSTCTYMYVFICTVFPLRFICSSFCVKQNSLLHLWKIYHLITRHFSQN